MKEKKPIRQRLDEIIHELIMDYSGDEIEVEMIRSCSLTNISLVLREKQKINAEFGDGYISTAMGCD